MLRRWDSSAATEAMIDDDCNSSEYPARTAEVDMTNEQRKVVAGAAAAVVFSVAFFEIVFRLTDFGLTPPGGIETSWRLEYALRCDVFAALCLLAGVGKIA